MRRKVVMSLISLFVCYTIGAVLSVLYITKNTGEMNHVIRLHQVDQIRKSLVINVYAAQSDLFRLNTPFAPDTSNISGHMLTLEESVRQCASCHHTSAVGDRIKGLQSLILNYHAALDDYMAAASDRTETWRLKMNAVRISNDILKLTEGISHQASDNLEVLTGDTMKRLRDVRKILFATLVTTFFLAAAIALYLKRSITRPVSELVEATRTMAGGNFNARISYTDTSEFGELARHFNTMSETVRYGYEEIRKEIIWRRETEEALRESEERYALASSGANDGIWDWNLKSNRMYYSPRWKSILGYEKDELTDSPSECLDRVHPDDRPHMDTALAAHINGHSPHYKHEHRMLNREGVYLWVMCRGLAIRDSSGKAYRIAGSMSDITERKIVEEQLIFDALHDSLTGLPNRSLFSDRLRQAMYREKRRSDYLFAVLFLDIDRFKVFNDSLGHAMGDELLVAVSHRLKDTIRPEDTIARFGGDEFVILLEDLKDKTEAVHIAERIQAHVTLPYNINGREFFTSSSIGMTFNAPAYEKPEHFLRDADIAMYCAKSKGSGRYEIFDKGMYADALARMQLETDMRQAIKRNEFLLHYQPVISLRTGRITGVEALIRWQHPVRGLIYPSEFIRLAEETGLIIYIGEWVLHEACLRLRIWQDKFPSEPPMKMSVNMSSKQLFPHFVKAVGEALQNNSLAPDSLVLEVTESMLMENAETVSNLLLQLKEMRVQIHIDDFGTGYSSLSYLHQFPIDALKIDRSFIKKAGSGNLEIARAIATLSHGLNMEVVAEGVETEDQLAFIKTLDCEYVQGFLLSRPIESGAVEDLLNQGRMDMAGFKKHPSAKT
ncbi:MAG: EAL domain-containing protein [Nitrospirae bacterium]|nr:EAL domain-containing protein [Nitrospirota bacterium]